MRSGKVAPLLAAVVAVWLGGCSDDQSGFAGTIVEPAIESAPGYLTVVVDLEDDSVAGSSTVRVEVREEELFCGDGTASTPDQIQAGDEVSFTRFGVSQTDSSPPGIGGEDMRLAC